MDNEIEKYVQLTTKQRLKILAEQISTLIRNHSGQRPLLNAIPDIFRMHFGFSLKPEQYETESLEELFGKLRSHVQVKFLLGLKFSCEKIESVFESKDVLFRAYMLEY